VVVGGIDLLIYYQPVKQYKQVGNTVPPLFAQAIGTVIADHLRIYEQNYQSIAV